MTGPLLTYRGARPTIADDAFVAPTAVVIGDVMVGAGSGIWFGCVLRGDVHEIRVGARTNLQDGTVVHVTQGKWACHIGDDVTVGHLCLIHGSTLGDGAFVGMKACVMDGAVVEADAMVAAGALLTPGKRVPSGQLWGGSPARFMRRLTDEDRRMMRHTTAHYAELAETYRRDLEPV